METYPQFTEIREGFDIKLRFEEDLDSLEEYFDAEYECVTAIVEVSKFGVLLAETSLYGNYYQEDRLNDFLVHGYYEDMVSEAINEAKALIKKLVGE